MFNVVLGKMQHHISTWKTRLMNQLLLKIVEATEILKYDYGR